MDEERRLASKPPAEVAREFEALLIAQMIGAMRRTIPDGGMLQASAARKMLDGAFDTELARSIVKGADLGVARQLTAQLEHQAAASTPKSGGAAARTSYLQAASRAGTVHPSACTAPSAEPVLADEAGEAAGPGRERVLPVDGRLTSEFGVRRDPLTGAPRFHGGIDLAAPRGSAIRAAADGEVVFSGRSGASGNVVVVRHPDGAVTSYAHAARTLVRNGQKVAAGDILATVGSTGRSTGPHLHFSVERNGQAIDPTTFLQGAAASGLSTDAPRGAAAEG